MLHGGVAFNSPGFVLRLWRSIHRPALGVGNVEARLRAPRVQAFDFLRARDLHVVPRYGLVQEERLGAPFRLVRVAERVDREIGARAKGERSDLVVRRTAARGL